MRDRYRFVLTPPRFLYDLRIPAGADPTPFQPKPLDGEVEYFEVRIRCSRLRFIPDSVLASAAR